MREYAYCTQCMKKTDYDNTILACKKPGFFSLLKTDKSTITSFSAYIRAKIHVIITFGMDTKALIRGIGMDIFDKSLSIIMPAYNEGASIYSNLMKTAETVSTFHRNFEIIAVNDGSEDQTEEEIRRATMQDARIVLVSYMPNGGKGRAVKEGVLKAKGHYIAFLDADLDLSPAHLKEFLEKMDELKTEAVIGSKLHKDSKVNYPKRRKIMSFGYYLILLFLFHLPVKDTQTGIKLFRADCLKKLISGVKSTGFAYDIEILAKIAEQGGRIAEMPVVLEFQRKNHWGRIRVGDVWLVVRDTMALYASMKRKRTVLNEKTTGV